MFVELIKCGIVHMTPQIVHLYLVCGISIMSGLYVFEKRKTKTHH